MILLKNILLGKCVMVGLLVTKALNKVIQWYMHMPCKNLSFTVLQQLIAWVYTKSIISLSEVIFKLWEITSQNVYLIQNNEHNQLVLCLICLM